MRLLGGWDSLNLLLITFNRFSFVESCEKLFPSLLTLGLLDLLRGSLSLFIAKHLFLLANRLLSHLLS